MLYDRRIEMDKVGHWTEYPNEVVKYNFILDRLRPETAEKLCSGNVRRLLGKEV